MTTYFKVRYDNEASGPFVADAENFSELTWAGGGRGQVITLIDDGATGKLHVALIAGPLPSDNDVLTQGTTTADAEGAATTLLYPAYFRDDVSVTDNAALKDIRWVGPVADGSGVMPTHSFKFDGQTINVALQDIITFSGGQVAELIRLNNDVGATGEMEVRFISNLDAGLPVDGDTLTGFLAGNGTVQGEVHARSYTPFWLHRLLADLNDDPQFAGDDDMSSIDPTPSAKDTDQIVRLIGGANVDDTMILHMYGGSIEQASGGTKYAGLDVQVTSPNADTRPVLIQYDTTTGLDALVTDKWSNAWNPDSIAGNVRIMRKIRDNGVDIDGRRIRGFLGEFGDTFFTGSTTLGDATTSLALFASTDGNNVTAAGTVAGAPYNTVVLTDGFQTINYNNGNGPTEYVMSVDYGSATSPQTYERTKYLQRRGTAESIFGRNGQLVIGVNRNFAYDTEVNGPFLENSLIAWGTIVAYDTEVGGPFTVGESLDFAGGAKGRLLLLDDDGTTGTMIVEVTSGTVIGDDEAITGFLSGATAAVNDVGGVDTIESRSGIGWILGLDDDGTTGNIYYQSLAGLDPVNNSPIYGINGVTLVSCLVNGAVASRTINNQFVGVYTGTNFQTNFGIGIESADAILGDLNRNLADVQQGVPNNQSGLVTNLLAGDRVWCYDWDGATTDSNGDAVPRWDQLSNDALLNGAAVATIVVTEAIPADTPQVGALRVTNDEGIRVLIPYSSWATSTFTLTAAYNFSGTGVNDSVAATNDIAIAYLDQTVPAATTQLSFTGIFASNRQMAVRVLRGDNNPIVPFKTNPIFTASGFNVAAGRISDA